jgi:GT2 family glycosyltransferase
MKVGGFDERFEVISGDVDLCIRLNHIKYQSYYIGSCGYIIHKESQTRNTSYIHLSDYINTYRAYITAVDNNLEEIFNK